MNVFTAIMLIFAAVGLFDKITGGRLVLSKSFDDGLGTIGSMAVPHGRNVLCGNGIDRE